MNNRQKKKKKIKGKKNKSTFKSFFLSNPIVAIPECQTLPCAPCHFSQDIAAELCSKVCHLCLTESDLATGVKNSVQMY